MWQKSSLADKRRMQLRLVACCLIRGLPQDNRSHPARSQIRKDSSKMVSAGASEAYRSGISPISLAAKVTVDDVGQARWHSGSRAQAQASNSAWYPAAAAAPSTS